jgi:hypothetical protein
MDRYGGLLLGLFALAGVLVIGGLVLMNATGKAYACVSLLTPGPSAAVPTFTPSPAPTDTPSPTSTAPASPTAGPSATASTAATGTPSASPTPAASESPAASASPSASPTPLPQPTQLVGFPVSDLGRNHIVDTSTHITYQYCPPASGPHYNVAGVGPIKRAFYGPDLGEQNPGGWVHDLEHGYVVVAYSCANGCPSQAELDAMRQAMDSAPQSDAAKTCGEPNRMFVVRFDSMTSRFAYLAWDRAQLSDTFDPQGATTFMQQWQDQANPEQLACDH